MRALFLSLWSILLIFPIMSAWAALDCANIGDVCSDGTIYAGEFPASGRMFVTRCDAGMNWDGANCINIRQRLTWNNGLIFWSDTALVNCRSPADCDPDGKENTATLTKESNDSVAAEVQFHAAARYCNDLIANGHDDWYLPSAPELNVIYQNNAAIGGFLADTSSNYSFY